MRTVVCMRYILFYSILYTFIALVFGDEIQGAVNKADNQNKVQKQAIVVLVRLRQLWSGLYLRWKCPLKEVCLE